jgi:nitroreductase
MADILDVITSRRTVKHFLPKFVSWENIARVIDAGRHAPSCGNVQNWKFIVILTPSQKQDIAKAAYDQYDIAQAATLIVVCAEPEKAERYYGLRGERLYTIQNCAAAVQNMLLEAHSLGLGTNWIGSFDEDALKSLCNIPDEIRPQAIIAVGYPKEIPEKPPKYPLETLVYFGSWRNKLRDPAKYLHNTAEIMKRKAVLVKDDAKEIVEKGKKKFNELIAKREIKE